MTYPLLLYSDRKGQIFCHPNLQAMGFLPGKIIRPKIDDWIRLPSEGKIFLIPDFPAIGFNSKTKSPEYLYNLPHLESSEPCYGVSAFLPPGFIRTHLSHFGRDITKPLPMWAYTAVGMLDEEFVVTAFRIEDNPRWNPSNYDDRDLIPCIEEFRKNYPKNRLMKHLITCATEYHCFAAKNLFLRRWEVPVPTSPTCNSSCIGCLSFQEGSGVQASHERICFVPEVEEIVELIAPHLMNAPSAIASFGQGCEGEPILQADRIMDAISAVRRMTSRGTINLNTNGSRPDMILPLRDAGLDSIRISMNSARERLYNAYYKPRGYGFYDVKESIRLSVKVGLFTMINYLIFPGVTDTNKELDALSKLVEETGVNMLHMKNLNIDPDLYWEAMDLNFDRTLGLKTFVRELNSRFPSLFIGYFNQTKEDYKNT